MHSDPVFFGSARSLPLHWNQRSVDSLFSSSPFSERERRLNFNSWIERASRPVSSIALREIVPIRIHPPAPRPDRRRADSPDCLSALGISENPIDPPEEEEIEGAPPQPRPPSDLEMVRKRKELKAKFQKMVQIATFCATLAGIAQPKNSGWENRLLTASLSALFTSAASSGFILKEIVKDFGFQTISDQQISFLIGMGIPSTFLLTFLAATKPEPKLLASPFILATMIFIYKYKEFQKIWEQK